MKKSRNISIVAIIVNSINALLINPAVLFLVFSNSEDASSGVATTVRTVLVLSFAVIAPLISFVGILVGFLALKGKTTNEKRASSFALCAGLIVTLCAILMVFLYN